MEDEGKKGREERCRGGRMKGRRIEGKGGGEEDGGEIFEWGSREMLNRKSILIGVLSVALLPGQHGEKSCECLMIVMYMSHDCHIVCTCIDCVCHYCLYISIGSSHAFCKYTGAKGKVIVINYTIATSSTLIL